MDTHYEVLSGDTREILSLLGKQPFINQFYLAGGTALTIQIGHRISNDLDFFSAKDFSETSLIQKLKELGKFQLESKADQTVNGILGETKLSFLGYKYPLLNKLEKIDGVNIASVLDIVCMKIDAIASRGTKRDFIDVYFVAENIKPLSEILVDFKRKYASLDYNMTHIKKSLVYFEDAESDPAPKMLKPVKWESVKSFFEKEILEFI